MNELTQCGSNYFQGRNFPKTWWTNMVRVYQTRHQVLSLPQSSPSYNNIAAFEPRPPTLLPYPPPPSHLSINSLRERPKDALHFFGPMAVSSERGGTTTKFCEVVERSRTMVEWPRATLPQWSAVVLSIHPPRGSGLAAKYMPVCAESSAEGFIERPE